MNKTLWVILFAGFFLTSRQFFLSLTIESNNSNSNSNTPPIIHHDTSYNQSIIRGSPIVDAQALYRSFVQRGADSSGGGPSEAFATQKNQEAEEERGGDEGAPRSSTPFNQTRSILSVAFSERIENTVSSLHQHRATVASASTTKPNISYAFVRKQAIDYSEEWDKCLPGIYTSKRGRHRQVRSELWDNVKAVTDFSTTLQLDHLRILVLGDSVGMQLFTILDKATTTGGIDYPLEDRQIVAYAFSDHIAYGASKNGRVGAWRTTGFILESSEGKPPPNAEGGGWDLNTARDLLNVSIPEDHNERIGTFDTVLCRIPLGWMPIEQIAIPHIIESLHIASRVFGATTAILLTLPFVNNVQQHQRIPWLRKNEEIRKFVADFVPNETIPGIHRLVLMDLAGLTNHFIQVNAGLLGYLNHTDDPEMQYLDQVRLFEYLREVYPSAAHVCAGPTFKKQGRNLCFKNAISYDGMHICPNTYGGRIVAVTGCLMQCLYQDFDNGKFDASPSSQIKNLECQQECNDKFMTLRPVDTSNK
jgi:hypothetical protein